MASKRPRDDDDVDFYVCGGGRTNDGRRGGGRNVEGGSGGDSMKRPRRTAADPEVCSVFLLSGSRDFLFLAKCDRRCIPL